MSKTNAEFNTAHRLVVIDRRRQVAALRLRGYSEREIQKGLAAPKDGQAYLNPKTGEPWSLKAIHTDIVALEKSWHAEAMSDVTAHKARLFAELRELARACWKDKDYERVLKAISQQRELLGTDAPKQIKGEFTGKDGAPLNPPGLPFDLMQLTNDELDVLEKLIRRNAADAGAASGGESAP